MILFKKLTLSIFFFICSLVISPLSSAEKIAETIIYLTWQKDPLTTMTICWITEEGGKDESLFYRETGQEKWLEVKATPQRLLKTKKWIHFEEITGLKPATAYDFHLGSKKDSPVYKFRTMPATNDEPIRFVEGGDVYHDEIERVSKTNKLAAAQDPMFALIGGDLAYAADKFGVLGDNADRWLGWLTGWSREMVAPGGFLIPIVPCIGNHEVIGRYQQTPEQAPFFYALFPFPGTQGYNVLDFDSYLSLVILDSDHTHPVAGAQTKWLAHTLESRQKIPHVFAVYHVPAYPSVRSPVKPYHRVIRENWVPLFDKYSLSVAFEHHDHAYKRTHPLRLGSIHPNGVVYVGDGAWGAQARKPVSPDSRWYLAASAQETHFILVTLTKDGRRLQAINQQGDVFDQFEQKIPIKIEKAAPEEKPAPSCTSP